MHFLIGQTVLVNPNQNPGKKILTFDCTLCQGFMSGADQKFLASEDEKITEFLFEKKMIGLTINTVVRTNLIDYYSVFNCMKNCH